jgi:hypothetical protein
MFFRFILHYLSLHSTFPFHFILTFFRFILHFLSASVFISFRFILPLCPAAFFISFSLHLSSSFASLFSSFHFIPHFPLGFILLQDRSKTGDDLDTPPLFIVDDTVSDRCTQVYRCDHAKCRAGFKIGRYQSGAMALGDHRLEHNHDIGRGPTQRHYRTLRPAIIAQIIEMTERHARTGIRTLVGVNTPSGIFYEARRKNLTEQW